MMSRVLLVSAALAVRGAAALECGAWGETQENACFGLIAESCTKYYRYYGPGKGLQCTEGSSAGAYTFECVDGETQGEFADFCDIPTPSPPRTPAPTPAPNADPASNSGVTCSDSCSLHRSESACGGCASKCEWVDLTATDSRLGSACVDRSCMAKPQLDVPCVLLSQDECSDCSATCKWTTENGVSGCSVDNTAFEILDDVGAAMATGIIIVIVVAVLCFLCVLGAVLYCCCFAAAAAAKKADPEHGALL